MVCNFHASHSVTLWLIEFFPRLEESKRAPPCWSNAMWIRSSLWHEWVALFLSDLPFSMPHASRTVEDGWECQATVSYTLIHAPTAVTVNFPWWATWRSSDVSVYAVQLPRFVHCLLTPLEMMRQSLLKIHFRVRRAVFHGQLLLFHSVTFP